MWDLVRMSVFINYSFYVDYSSSQYRTKVLHILYDNPSQETLKSHKLTNKKLFLKLTPMQINTRIKSS
jgi:hypothetical protein